MIISKRKNEKVDQENSQSKCLRIPEFNWFTKLKNDSSYAMLNTKDATSNKNGGKNTRKFKEFNMGDDFT